MVRRRRRRRRRKNRPKIRSIKLFGDIDEMDAAVENAYAEATLNAKQALAYYVAFQKTIPFDTGELKRTAIDHLLNSGTGGSLIFELEFVTPYAKKVAKQTNFFEKNKNRMIRTVVNAIKDSFRQQGLDV